MRIINRLSQVLLFLATLSGISMTIFVALSALMRYVISKPFGFTEELVGLLFAALVFLSFPYISTAKQHINITLFTDLYSNTLQNLANVLSNLLTIVFCIWFGYFAYEFCVLSYELNSKSDLAGLILWPWMSLMVLSFALVALVCVYLIRHKNNIADETNNSDTK